MFDLEAKRLTAARNVLAAFAQTAQADLGAQLWNGEVVPLGAGARSDVRIVLRSADAVRRAILAPRLATLFALYAEGEIDIAGGTMLEAVARWDHIRALKALRGIGRWRAALSLWPFLLRAKAAGASAPGFSGGIARDYAKGRADRDLVAFHYDVSNAFFAQFLDRAMVYSCGWFANPDVSLDDAQTAKLDRICAKLMLQPDDRLLDIGCGWGALLCHAAEKYGARCHGVTLSQEQFVFCREKIARLGLQDRATVELKDYRAIAGAQKYDKIAQIEMFEHVGFANHDLHFSHIRKLLRPRGLYLHQATTRMATRDIGAFRNKTGYQDAITRFIFPGGELDYIGLTATNLERLGFEIHDVEALREHYQLTLTHWARRLEAAMPQAAREAGSARARLWLLYFVLFAKGFERNTVSCFQTLASRRQGGASGLPLSADGAVQANQKLR